MARLGDVTTQIRGVSYKPDDVFSNLTEDSVILLRANNIRDGEINLEDLVYISKSKVHPDQYLVAGDILICTSSGSKGLVGKAAYIDRNMGMTFGAFCKVVRPTGVYPPYLGHFFNSPYYQEKIRSSAAGANINNIRNEHIDELQFMLPDIEMQRRIAAILDKVTSLIALRKQQLAKLDELVKARFVEMFGDLILNPYGWNFKPLSVLCDVRDGTHDSPVYVTDGYPLLTSKNFSSGFLDFSGANLISRNDFEKINQRSKVDKGDIVMPMIGTIGHPVIIDADIPFAIKNVALIKFGKANVSNIFVKYLLDSDYFCLTIQETNRGGTQKFISLGDIRKIPVPIVSDDLQKQFAIFVEKKRMYELTMSKSLDILEVIKKLLLEYYFVRCDNDV